MGIGEPGRGSGGGRAGRGGGSPRNEGGRYPPPRPARSTWPPGAAARVSASATLGVYSRRDQAPVSGRRIASGRRFPARYPAGVGGRERPCVEKLRTGVTRIIGGIGVTWGIGGTSVARRIGGAIVVRGSVGIAGEGLRVAGPRAAARSAAPAGPATLPRRVRRSRLAAKRLRGSGMPRGGALARGGLPPSASRFP